MNTELLMAVVPLAASLLVGCAHRDQVPAEAPKTPQMTPASGVASEQRREAPRPSQSVEPTDDSVEVTTTAITIEPSLAEACGVSLPEAFFEFDSSQLEPQTPATLDKFVTAYHRGRSKIRRSSSWGTRIHGEQTPTT